MTEQATEKQKGFMRKLGFDESTISLATKDSAKMLISAKLEDEDRAEVVKPGLPSQNQAFPKAPAPNGQLAMYVSYAKDIFCAMIEAPIYKEETSNMNELMTKATDLVKQAQRELS